MAELKLENSLVDSRYEITERLSRGSYAEIFLARDRESHGCEVVIKALNPSLQGTPDVELERTLVENFQNEARALDKVRHPHVILRLGHGTAADLRGTPFHYLVLEYMPGGDLLSLCRHHPSNSLSLHEALFFFRQVCEGLAYAHSNGIIHRDLKPNNFLLSGDWKVLKIADFGVAKITTGDDAEVTRVGAGIYAPPEHHPEEREQSHRLTAAADIYSLAKSFYTVLAGRPPSRFKREPIAVLPDSLMAEPWGPALARVLRRATDNRPTERQATVIEFWSDLAQVGSSEHDDEVTIVRPRLSVSPGALPETPALPDFEHSVSIVSPRLSPSSVRLVAESEDAVGTITEDSGRDDQETLLRDLRAEPEPEREPRGEKLVIELPPRKRPVSKRLPDSPVKPANRVPPKSTDLFNMLIQRRTFMVPLIIVILGVLVAGYFSLHHNGAAFGFGAPTEVEVVTPGLNVRLGPSMRDPVLGVVPRGSRHRVVTQSEQWIQIEVGRWDDSEPHVADQARGWVYARQDYVRVVARRLW